MRSRSSGAAPTAGRPRRRWPTAAPALPRAGRPQRLGHLGLHPVGAARPAHPQGVRVRQAALHRLPALRRPAAAAAGVPRDVPAGAATTCGSATRSPSQHRGDPLPELDFGPVISAREGRRAGRAVRRGARRSRAAAAPRLARATAASCPARTPRPTSRPASVLEPPAHWSLHHAEPFGPLDSVVCVDTEAEFARRDERQQRLPRRQHRHRRPRLRGAGRPSSCRPSRSGSTSRAAAATARRSSAASASPGRAPSSAATCSCTPSRYGPDGDAERLYGNFPDYSSYPAR